MARGCRARVERGDLHVQSRKSTYSQCPRHPAPTELLRAVCSVFAMSRVVPPVTPPGIDVELSAAKPYFRLWSSTLRSGILGVRFLAPSGGSAGCAPLAYHDIASPEVARRLSQLGFRNATKTAVGQSCGCQVAHGEDDAAPRGASAARQQAPHACAVCHHQHGRRPPPCPRQRSLCVARVGHLS